MLAFVVGLIVSVGPAFATSDKPVVGVVVRAQGTALLDGKPLKENAFVHAASVIETGDGGCTALAIVSGAEVRFNRNSRGRVEGGGPRATMVFLDAGQVWVRILHGKSGFQVHGPHAVVSAGAGQTDVAVASRTVVKVYEGAADVTNGLGRRSVAAREQTHVDGPGEAPGVPTPLPPQDVEAWQDSCAGPSPVQNPGVRRSSGPSLRLRPKRAGPRP